MITALCLALNSSRYQGLSLTLVKLKFGRIKKWGVALLYLVLLLCSVAFMACSVRLVNAQTGSTITILSSGGVRGTDLIQRDGDVYTLTGDIFGTIKVEKNSVTIDGAGYAIKGLGNGVDLRKTSDAAIPSAYGNVSVQNIRFCDGDSIFASSYGNSFINNTFEGGGVWIVGANGDIGNVIKHNIFINTTWSIFVDYTFETKNVVTENDFINSGIRIGLYSSFVVDRNYWNDYKTLYPNAKEIEHTGIWDTPYNYDKNDDGFSRSLYADCSPLVNPVSGVEAHEVNGEPEFVPTTSTVEDKPESFPTTLITVAIMSVVIVSIGLLFYFKRHKQSPVSF